MSYLLESNIYAKRKGKKAIPWTASEKHKLAVKKKRNTMIQKIQYHSVYPKTHIQNINV